MVLRTDHDRRRDATCDERGAFEKVPQLGNVVLESDVEIGANSTVDRARLGTTRIGRFVLSHSFMRPGLVATASAVPLATAVTTPELVTAAPK